MAGVTIRRRDFGSDVTVNWIVPLAVLILMFTNKARLLPFLAIVPLSLFLAYYAYSLVGALCGLLGQQPLKWFFDSPAIILPWVLVVLFLTVASGLHHRLPKPALLTRFLAKARLSACRVSATRGGFAMGLATPLLPCAPLYLLFGVSLLSGSALRGAEFAAAFGLGTIPLLWLAQHSFQSLRRRLTPRTIGRLQRSLALVAALVIAWRLHDTLPLFQSAAAADLPSCCP